MYTARHESESEIEFLARVQKLNQIEKDIVEQEDKFEKLKKFMSTGDALEAVYGQEVRNLHGFADKPDNTDKEIEEAYKEALNSFVSTELKKTTSEEEYEDYKKRTYQDVRSTVMRSKKEWENRLG